jgi:hypothetical protein
MSDLVSAATAAEAVPADKPVGDSSGESRLGPQRRRVPIMKSAIMSLTLSAVLTIGLTAARAPAQQLDLQSFLVGKWHQELGPYVTDTVLNGDGTYTSITIQRGTTYWEGVQGNWEIRVGNQLWQSRRDGRLPEGTPIRVIDANHFQNKLGIATRVR